MMNPIQMMIQLVQSGGNPMQALQQMAQGNPQVGQFMQNIQGKSPDQLRQMAENLARERGTTIEQVARQIGLPFQR